MEAGSAESRNNTNQNIILGVSRINLASVVAYNAVTHSRCKSCNKIAHKPREEEEQSREVILLPRYMRIQNGCERFSTRGSCLRTASRSFITTCSRSLLSYMERPRRSEWAHHNENNSPRREWTSHFTSYVPNAKLYTHPWTKRRTKRKRIVG